jgi:hypothetical protein
MDYYNQGISPLVLAQHFTEKKQSTPTGFKLGNSQLSLNNVRLSGFGKAVDMDTNCSVIAKNVDLNNCNKGINVTQSSKRIGNKDMALDLDECEFEEVKKAVVAPNTFDIKAKKTKFKKVDVAFDIYLPEHKLLELGLPKDTPQEFLLDLLKEIKKSENTEKQLSCIAKSSLIEWLGIASSTVTLGMPVVQALIAYATV